ncbi:hypothetical protein MTAT_04350 [Moorella thermoacetica]|uniref:Uncharacterized protein n=1 Tax=Neomoorella thermoacetica TaxID=1525 RepID=A0AAC9MVL1_NEOTH|nr:hypothetical protein [Moorella thermoacetica]AOQ24766.1 hypothetical protein Maut_02338 [Moorella thermoacetica]TYL15696.1 hypothetical protein MTAT_04350 [Moorella thermoacetica]
MINDREKATIEMAVKKHCQEMREWIESNSIKIVLGDKEIPIYIFLPLYSPTDNISSFVGNQVIFDETEEDISEDPEVEELWAIYEEKYTPIKRITKVIINGNPNTICTTHDITDAEWESIQAAITELYNNNGITCHMDDIEGGTKLIC